MANKFVVGPVEPQPVVPAEIAVTLVRDDGWPGMDIYLGGRRVLTITDEGTIQRRRFGGAECTKMMGVQLDEEGRIRVEF